MNKDIKILQVEDEVIAAMVIEMELKNHGYPQVFHVTTGEDAIVKARELMPDLILMDIRLAGKFDGIETAKAIKAEKDIPIIFITGYKDYSIKERAEVVKPIGYMIKPLEIPKLKDMIQNHFG